MAEHRRLYLLRVFHGKHPFRATQFTPVAHLAAGFGVERRAVEHDHAQLPLFQRIHLGAIAVEGQHLRRLFQAGIARKTGFRANVVKIGRHAEGARRARLRLLPCHGGVKRRLIDNHPALAADVGRQIKRKAVGVMQAEGGVARKLRRARARQGIEFALDNAHAVFDGGKKALLFLPQHGRHALLFLTQLRIRLAHRGHEIRHHAVEKRRTRAQLVAMAHRAADDATQHITTPLIAGNHAVRNQKRAGADMIGQHLERGRGQVGTGAFARGGADQGLEQVDVIVGLHPLQHRRNALQPHARIDGRTRQRMEHAVLVAAVLHENQVPDLNVAIAVLVG